MAQTLGEIGRILTIISTLFSDILGYSGPKGAYFPYVTPNNAQN